jgi:hypothetical protein
VTPREATRSRTIGRMLTDTEKRQFREQGYLVKPVLAADEVAQRIAQVEAAVRERDAGARMFNLQFLQPGKDVRAIQNLICDARITGVVGELLGGGDIVIDGASLFYGDAGVDYRQGWRRDLMQIPDDEIDPAWFGETHFHNYVQVNLPLCDDGCLWIVPGSHRRAFDADERAIFGDDVRIAPVDAPLAAGRPIVAPPGHAVFYNNYAIHRGYGGVLAHKRVTLHFGFHSTRHAPTPHFAVLDRHEYTPAYLATLDADVRAALEKHLAERAKHPQMDVYHAHHQAFIRKEFTTR